MRPFALVRPTTLAAARERALGDPAARPYRAAGVDLLDLMKEGLTAPAELIELAAIAGADGQRLRALDASAAGLRIGALVTLAQLEAAPAIAPAHAALREAAASAATPSVRGVATVGGNLLQRPRCWYFRHHDLACLKKAGPRCLAEGGENRLHAILGGGPCHIVHPSTLAVALVALDAAVTVHGDAGPRDLPVERLFVLPQTNIATEHALAPGELLLDLALPAAAPGQRSVYEVAKEKLSHDWPLAEVALALTLEAGTIRRARVALGHVAPVPWRATALEDALVGQPPSADLFARLAPLATQGARPMSQNAYKIPLVHGLVRAALHRACEIPTPE